MQSVEPIALDWPDLVTRCSDEDLARQIVKAFFSDSPTNLEELSMAVEHMDYERVMSQAHALKGSAAAISAKPLAKAAQRLETSASEEDAEMMKMDFQQLRKEFQRLSMLVLGTD